MTQIKKAMAALFSVMMIMLSAGCSASPLTQTGDQILIAYYSYTGNTEAAAQQIADLTGGTLAEIQRVNAYEDLRTEAEAGMVTDQRSQ